MWLNGVVWTRSTLFYDNFMVNFELNKGVFERWFAT